MPKLTIGLITGAALISAAAAASVVGGGAVAAPAPQAHVALVATAPSPSPAAAAVTQNSGAAPRSGGQVGVQGGGSTSASTGVAGSAAVPARSVRTLRLTLPITTVQVGKTISGTVQVSDVVAKVSTPAVGVPIAVQIKRAGAKDFVDVATDVTTETGVMQFSSTITENDTFRAIYRPATGKAVISNTVAVTATAQVTWGARPDMDVARNAPSAYVFRITGNAAQAGHLEYMKKGAKVWTKLKAAKLPATDLISQTIKFPTAGVWYVRGASERTTSIGSGYTTTLTVTVR